ncbi:MAG: DPP IV N-terminal domain-containing protein [Balneolaceae bacterium]
MKPFFTIFTLLLLFVLPDGAQSQNGDSVTTDDYERAESQLSWNVGDKVYNQNVSPNWINNDQFWYRIYTRNGDRYMLVNITENEKSVAFDHERLAAEISEHTESAVNPENLLLGSLEFSDDLSTIRFGHDRKNWECSLTTYECETTDYQSNRVDNSVTSPDGNLAAFTKDHNLWVRNLETGEDIQLTTEGEKHYSFARNNQGWSRSDRPILTWSPDSKKISTFRLDERDVGQMVLWKTVEGRPELDQWPYALPGDSIVPMLERVVIDVENQTKTWLQVDPDHQRASNCCGLVRNGEWVDNEWSEDGSKLAFVSTSRDYKDVKLQMANPETGEVEDIFEDRDDIFFESNLTSRGVPNWRILHNSDEFIWFNRSDNWGHLYLRDLETGELKNQITEGNWNVVDILRVNEEERTILFTAVGKEDNRDPHFEHLYRINFDGSGMELLTENNAHHSVNLSPDANFIVDTYSDFQTPQVTVIRDDSGKRLMTIEEADASELRESGWREPIPFSAKARDGETDIYGIMILPSNFDESKSYPIINAIYPGPQGGSVGTRHFSSSRRGQAHALAELGFVVVAIDAMGSSPIRSRDFHTAYHGNMLDNGLPDQIAAMEQLADKYSFIDLDHVGIYGHSGGGFATGAALTQYPEFFKVGVSGAGNHDNRNYTYYWGEKYQGLLEESEGSDNYESSAVQLQAENLEGKLLLSYGTMDTNVHPSMTLLFVDELIKHNKDFDLLVMPNRGHGFANEPYSIRRTWDYFVEHLTGKTPPKEFQIQR